MLQLQVPTSLGIQGLCGGLCSQGLLVCWISGYRQVLVAPWASDFGLRALQHVRFGIHLRNQQGTYTIAS